MTPPPSRLKCLRLSLGFLAVHGPLGTLAERARADLVLIDRTPTTEEAFAYVETTLATVPPPDFAPPTDDQREYILTDAPLPPDLRAVFAVPDLRLQLVTVYLTSETFDLVEYGAPVPDLVGSWRRVVWVAGEPMPEALAEWLAGNAAGGHVVA